MPRAKHSNGTKIRIRMYRVGFGDCFLLSLPTDEGGRHVLIDCGVHAAGDIATIRGAVDDLWKETGGRLALVVATHEHQDHLSGFAKCAEVFKRFTVDEVWMPWTLDPDDAQARTLRRQRLALVEQLRTHFAAAGAPFDVEQVMANLSSNDSALNVLRNGFRGKHTLRYLSAGTVLQNAAGTAGLTVKVLGPPRDERFLSKMSPPAGQRYVRPAVGGGPEPVNALHPFDATWEVAAANGLSEPERAELRKVATEPVDGLAFALDQIVNNTSVVLLLAYRGQHLLFPGDAQWGSWNSWIEEDDAKDLLGQVAFYKVAHHGSFNATPKDALEAMPTGRFAAMVSTQSKPWPSIPQTKLVEAIVRKTGNHLARSDALPMKGAPAASKSQPLPEGFSAGPFWVDYTLGA